MSDMKISFLVSILWSVVIASCNTKQDTGSKKADSLQTGTKQKDSDAQASMPKLAKAGNHVKSESPDAITKFEQGYVLSSANDGVAQSPINIIASGLQKDF